jgi:hypothetical protein
VKEFSVEMAAIAFPRVVFVSFPSPEDVSSSNAVSFQYTGIGIWYKIW